MKEIKTIYEIKDEKIYDDNSLIKYKNKIETNEIVIKGYKFYKEKLKIIINHIYIFVLFGLSYYFYFLSLESCFDGEGPCSININWIKKKVIQEIISCGLLTIIIQLIIFKRISKYHIFHIIIIFFFFIFIVME